MGDVLEFTILLSLNNFLLYDCPEKIPKTIHTILFSSPPISLLS
jgi:hypothetical protein